MTLAATAVTVFMVSATPKAQSSGPVVLTAEVLETDLSKHTYSSPNPPTQCNYDGIDCSPGLRQSHYASAVGPNGNVAGNTGLGAFWWTKATGLVEIPETFGNHTLNQGGFAKGVNGKGQVVGVYYPKGANGDYTWQGQTYQSRAYLWSQADGFVDLGVLGAPFGAGYQYLLSSEALAINESGQIVGWAEVALPNAPFRQQHAFLWQPDSPNAKTGTMIDLGKLGGPFYGQSFGSRAVDISDAGVIAGNSALTLPNGQDGNLRAFLWTPATPNGATGTMTEIAPAPGMDFSVLDMGWYWGDRINNAGQAIGWSYSYSTGRGPAFVASSSGVQHYASFPGAMESTGWAISPGGAITGRAYLPDGSYTAFFRAPDGTLTNLGDLPGAGRWSAGVGIDDTGLITGTSYYMSNGAYAHATAWQNGGIVDLHPAGWGGHSEVHVQNQEGLAAGYVWNGVTRAVVWTFEGGAPPPADFDGDGTPDSEDADDDNDGVGDTTDKFPLDAAESTDADGDGTGDNGDTDDDNDGVGDTTDAFPLDAAESADTDGDGVGNNADAFDNDPTETTDTDGDGVGDNRDLYPNDPTASANLVIGGKTSTIVARNGAQALLSSGEGQCLASSRNHGQYVSCVGKVLNGMKAQSLITGAEKDLLQSLAAQTTIGRK